MGKIIRWALLAGVVALGSTGAGEPWRERVAWAQGSPEVSLRVDAEDIEMGESVTVTLTAMSEAAGAQPTDPQLKAPSGWVVTGPMISTQTQMSIINGRVTQRSGFRASWHVVPTTAGTFEVGPASFSLDRRRVTAGSVRVQVRPPSPGGPSKPKPRQHRRDPFGGLFGPLFGLGDDDDDLPPPRPQAPPPEVNQLSLDAPLEPQAFLRAVVDKEQAVVGEQVTLTIFLYSVPRSYQVVDPHEPSTPDFQQRLVSTGENEAHPVNVGGARWMVQLIRKIALFPLKSGELTVGPMTITMLGQGLRGSGLRGGLVRASKALVVQVSEPPAGPRPAGYMLGDVGSFSLQAQVEPRKIEAGGSVAVTATVRGTGNPPTALRLPERKGVTWLEPEVREVIDSGDGVVGGSRTFLYLVKITEPGNLDLGELSVSFWNPKLKEYQVSRAKLGSIDVAPGAAPAVSASATPVEVDPFAVVGPVRATPGSYAPLGEMLTDRPWFWVGLAGAPLSVLLAQGVSGALGQIRRLRREQDESAATRARRALQEAKEAEAKGDSKGAAAATERALVAAVEASAGVKLRALRAHEVEPALLSAGWTPEQAREARELLSACEQERFLPAGAAPSSSLVGRAAPLVKGLLR
jgi:hypothetical protein